MMSTKGEKCLELVLLDDSNYESWYISILNNIEPFNPYLLCIVDSSICPPNITWTNLETKCSIYLSTNSILESKCKILNLKGTWGFQWMLTCCGNISKIVFRDKKSFPSKTHYEDKRR
jgi:hypothetical protein